MRRIVKIIFVTLLILLLFIVILIVVLGTSYPLGRYVVNSLQESSCGGILDGQDEKTIDIPKEFQNKKVALKDTAKYGSDSFLHYCTPQMNKTNLRITESSYTGADSIAFPKNETFTIESAYMFRQVGIGSVDSGDSWRTYYLVKDSGGKLYKIYAPTFSRVISPNTITK